MHDPHNRGWRLLFMAAHLDIPWRPLPPLGSYHHSATPTGFHGFVRYGVEYPVLHGLVCSLNSLLDRRPAAAYVSF